jgi:hypothetical protein
MKLNNLPVELANNKLQFEKITTNKFNNFFCGQVASRSLLESPNLRGEDYDSGEGQR